MAGCDIIEANRCAISPSVMLVFDSKARIRRRGAEDNASKQKASMNRP
jgi:hypothetical protein